MKAPTLSASAFRPFGAIRLLLVVAVAFGFLAASGAAVQSGAAVSAQMAPGFAGLASTGAAAEDLCMMCEYHTEGEPEEWAITCEIDPFPDEWGYEDCAIYGPHCMEINPGECDETPPEPGGAYPWWWTCNGTGQMECWGEDPDLVAMSGQVVLPRLPGSSPFEHSNISFDAEADVYRRICDESIVVAWGLPQTGSTVRLAASRSRRIVLS